MRYIEIDSIIEQIKAEHCERCTNHRCTLCDIDDVLLLLEEADDADVVEVKHGAWKEHFSFGCWHYDCPFCDDGYATKEQDKTPPNHCPNCGAIKEIIKALECIGREAIECAECPYGEYLYPTCHEVAGRDALYLIKRQKAEIERLKGNAVKQPILIYPYAATAIELVPSKEQIKAEAIKDFAERLKESLWDLPTMSDGEGEYDYVCMESLRDFIDNLVKEMIGEQE